MVGKGHEPTTDQENGDQRHAGCLQGFYWQPNFGGRDPKFLTQFYKFGSPLHVSKSGDDRPSDLGD